MIWHYIASGEVSLRLPLPRAFSGHLSAVWECEFWNCLAIFDIDKQEGLAQEDHKK